MIEWLVWDVGGARVNADAVRKKIKEQKPTQVHLVWMFSVWSHASFLASIPDLQYKPDSKSLFNITTKDRGLILKLT